MTAVRESWKAVVAFVIAVVAGGISQGLINGAAAAWLTIAIGAFTTTGVWCVRNQPTGSPNA